MQKVIDGLKNKILEIHKEIELIEKLNLSKPVNEKTWFRLCSTPLRNTKYMGIILQNIFPNATNIKVNPNNVSFDLYDTECKLSTSQIKKLEVNTNWNIQYFSEDNPKTQYHELLELYEITDWRILTRKILGTRTSTFKLFFMWFFCYKWKKFKYTKEECLVAINEYNRLRERNIEENNALRLLEKEKIEKIKEKVLPELEKFGVKIVGSNRFKSPYDL